MSYVTLGPLTTIFTPPSGCATSWTYQDQGQNGITGGILEQNAFQVSEDFNCFPYSFIGVGRATYSSLYSPGICPYGYTTGLEFVSNGETTAVCCQQNYDFSTDGDLVGCISTYPSGSITVVSAEVHPIPSVTYPLTTVTGPLQMWGQPITIAFQQQDLSLFPASTSLGPTSTTTVTVLPPTLITETLAIITLTASTPPQSTSTTIPAAPGLSKGAQAGICIGAAIGGFLVFAVAWLLYKQCRRPSEPTPPTYYASPETSTQTPIWDSS